MARQRDLPPRCYAKHGAFFYVAPGGKWHSSAAMTKRYIRDKMGVEVEPPSLKLVAHLRNNR